MHDDDIQRRELAPHEVDDRDQEAIMGLVIAEHPIQLTLSELILQMVGGEAAFGEADQIERGVRELVGIGLLHRSGETIRPTRAALRFHHLLLDRDTEED